MFKKIFIVFFLLLPTLIFAQSSLKNIQNLVKSLNYISHNNYSNQKTHFLIRQHILKYVDFETIATKVSYGWGHLLSNVQKNTFIKKLQEKIIQDLSVQLRSKKISQLRIKNVQKITTELAKVSLNSGNMFVNVDLLLTNINNKWLISDVLINQDSLVLYYKNQTKRLINRYGLNYFTQ